MVAVPQEAPKAGSIFDRIGPLGKIVPHPALDDRSGLGLDRRTRPAASDLGSAGDFAREAARLEGVHLAAREMAHLLNNDLAVAVGAVDLLEERAQLPPHLHDLLKNAATSLETAARRIEELQRVVRVVVKETPAGESLDLERSRFA